MPSHRPGAEEHFSTEIGTSWLMSAKIARKEGHMQTSYSANLQARQLDPPYAFIQDCKLTKASGEGLRALQEIENALLRLDDRDKLDNRMHAKVFRLYPERILS